MPTYDYLCPENGRELSVFHAMSVRVATWGDLCDLAEVDVGDTDRATPVERRMGTGFVLSPKSGKPSGFGGSCCAGGGCSC